MRTKFKIRASDVTPHDEVYCISLEVEFLFLSKPLIVLNPRFRFSQKFWIICGNEIWLLGVSIGHLFLPRKFGEAVVVAGDRVVLAPATNYVGHQHSLANAVVDVDAIKV